MQKKVFFYNSHKEKLSGILFAPSKKGRFPALIFCHGFTSGKHTKIELAKRISNKGFAVLIFDASGCGESSGKFEEHTISKYVSDLKSALSFLKTQQFVNPKKIAIAGHSQGGMVVTIFASRYKGIHLAIPIDAPLHILKNRGPDSPFADINMLKRWKKDGFVEFDVRLAGSRISRKLAYQFVEDAKNYDLSKLVKEVRCPIIIVQGDSDTLVLPNHARKLHRYANDPKELILVKGVNHRYKGEHEKILEKILVTGLKKYLRP